MKKLIYIPLTPVNYQSCKIKIKQTFKRFTFVIFQNRNTVCQSNVHKERMNEKKILSEILIIN